MILGWSGAPPDRGVGIVKRNLRASGSLIVGIGPASWAGADSQLGADLFLESEILSVRGSDCSLRRRGLPAGLPAELSCLVDLHRRDRGRLDPVGRMPAMYQSVLVAGARDRNARFVGSRFHQTHQVPAMPPGQVGGDYLDAIGGFCAL